MVHDTMKGRPGRWTIFSGSVPVRRLQGNGCLYEVAATFRILNNAFHRCTTSWCFGAYARSQGGDGSAG